MKQIGIIGSGVVAQTLGKGLIRHGYSVMLGTRDTAKLTDWLAESGTGASAGSMDEAAAFGEIVVLAVAGRVAQNAIELAGASNLANKTVIDATNPIAEAPPANGVLKFFTTLDNALMEQLQDAYPEAHFVKAFNSVGSAQMVNPDFDTQPTMFICGNKSRAKDEVVAILTQFGWEVADMGGVEAARAIEPLCMLWCIPGFRDNSWSHAFKLLRH